MNYKSIPVVVLFVITVMASFAVYFTKAYLSKKITDDVKDYNLFNTIMSFVCGFSVFALGGFETKISLYTVVLALVFGFVIMVQSVLYNVATNLGAFSYTSVIYSSSTMITALSGYLFWGENLSELKIVGILLMFGCYILSNKKDEFKKKVTLKWFLVCIVMALAVAVVGLCQKTHQMSAHKDEFTMFLVTAYSMSGVYSFVMYIISAVKTGKYGFENKGKSGRIPFVILMAVMMVSNGIFLALNGSINLYLTGVTDTAVFFPITSGAGIMLNVVASLVFFKEKLSLRQWLGLMLGTASVVMLCI